MIGPTNPAIGPASRPTAPTQTRSPAQTMLLTVPLTLAIIAESAWLAALAGPLNAFAHRDPVFDPLAAAAFVIVGMVVSRVIGLRLGRRWPAIALVSAVVAAAIGVGMSAESRAALSAGGIGGVLTALAVNPGGLLAGLAFLRGVGWGHGGLPIAEDRLDRLLAGGSFAIVLAAIIGAATLEPWRSAFLGNVFADGLLFVGTAILALAFTRQASAAGGIAAGWQRNPTWVVAMLTALLTIGALAIVFSGQVKPSVEIIAGLLLVPLIVAGMLVGWSKRGLRLFAVILLLAFILAAISRGLYQGQQAGDSTGGSSASTSSPVETAVSIGIGTGVAIVLVLLVLVLIRLWMRQSREGPRDVVEERSIDRTPDTDTHARSRRRFGLTRTPTDAVSAYRALLADLQQRHGVRREPWETPREHAGRLTGNGDTGVSLNLLAADYALAAFGDRQLTKTENGRALGRWRLLRRRLTATPEPLEDELPSSP